MVCLNVSVLVLALSAGTVFCRPTKRRYTASRGHKLDSNKHFQPSYKLPLRSSYNNHKPIYDDDTTTSSKTTTPTTATTSTLHPGTIKTMSPYKRRMIKVIESYQESILMLLKADSVSPANPKLLGKGGGYKLRVSEKTLSFMSVSELHGVLADMQKFYRATLGNMCCPLG